MITSTKGRQFLGYVSPIYEQSIIMQAILEAIGAEWDEAEKLADEVLAQLFPQTATWGITYWEWLLGIPPNHSVPIEQRRARVLASMQTRWPITRERMENIVNQFVVDKKAFIEERYSEYTFTVVLPHGGFESFYFLQPTMILEEVVLPHGGFELPNIIPVIEKSKPAHLAALYEARSRSAVSIQTSTPKQFLFPYRLCGTFNASDDERWSGRLLRL